MTTSAFDTTSGAISGVRGTAISVFKGIPYADDAGGSGRFRPPQPAKPWSGVRDCSEYGPSCPQISLEQMLGMPMPVEAEPLMGTWAFERKTGEDCLVLNIWTPAPTPTSSLPVLVWLHGGGWSTGSASWPLYDFTNLARNGDCVVVGINHRLGILGFLDLSSFDEDFTDSGMAGMLDIVAALEWIRDNITNFGGNPGNVTVFGESGGGAKVSALLAMPSAAGLVHQAVAMSGSCLTAVDPARAAENAAAVVQGLGGDLRRTLSADVQRLVEAEALLPGRRTAVLTSGRDFRPVLSQSLPGHPVDALRSGAGADVTLVSGCNNDEMLAFLMQDPELWSLTEDALLDRLRPGLGGDAERVIKAYRSCRPGETPTSLLIAIATDVMFRVPQIRLAEAKATAGGNPTYMYLFSWGMADPTGTIRAPHGIDMPYFFDNVDKAAIADGPHAGKLTAVTNRTLTTLAHTGSPSHADLPEWPAYRLDDKATMRLDVNPELVHDPGATEAAVWDGINLPGVGFPDL
jgi:para-nitrobenzyl esterase